MTRTCNACAERGYATRLSPTLIGCPVRHNTRLRGMFRPIRWIDGTCRYTLDELKAHWRTEAAKVPKDLAYLKVLNNLVNWAFDGRDAIADTPPAIQPYASQRGRFAAEIAKARCGGVCVDDKGVCDALRPDGECSSTQGWQQ